MEIRSEGKLKGVVYKDNFYVRVAFSPYPILDLTLQEEVAQWWAMDTPTRVRDLATVALLNEYYEQCRENYESK